MRSDLPKPLVPVAGKPIVRHLIEALEQAGLQNITVVIGHGADEMKAELGGDRLRQRLPLNGRDPSQKIRIELVESCWLVAMAGWRGGGARGAGETEEGAARRGEEVSGPVAKSGRIVSCGAHRHGATRPGGCAHLERLAALRVFVDPRLGGSVGLPCHGAESVPRAPGPAAPGWDPVWEGKPTRDGIGIGTKFFPG